MKKIALALTLGAALLAMLTGCSGGNSASQEPVTFRFAYDYWPGYYPALIANELGYLKEDNITLEAVKPENTDALMADFLAGKYDFMAVSMGDVITLTQSNDDIYFIIISDESAGGDAVVVKNDIASIEDLRGKQIGTNLGGFGELFITSVLKSKGIEPSEVTFVNMDAAEAPAKLSSNELQAVHTWEPYVSQAVGMGNKVLFTSADAPGLVLDGIVVRGETVRKHKDAVAAFVKDWFKAVDFWTANPEEGNQAAAKQINVDASEISLDGIKLHDLKSNQSLYDKDNPSSAYATANLYVEFFITKGSLRSAPDIYKLLNPEFLK